MARLLMLAAILTALLVACWPSRGDPRPPDGWALIFCDVGQGDAIVMRAAPAQAVLLDVGRDPEALSRCLRSAGVRRIPLLLLSHFDADHVGAVPWLLSAFDVDRAVVTPSREPRGNAERVLRALEQAGTPVSEAFAGARGTVGSVGLELLWPGRVPSGGSPSNNSSLVVRVRVAGISALLCGDIEPEAQRQVMRRDSPDVDVVSIPHHGSPNQDPGFADWVQADHAVASVGEDNGYGHPSPATLTAYADVGTIVHRTDRQGMLAFGPPEAPDPVGMSGGSGRITVWREERDSAPGRAVGPGAVGQGEHEPERRRHWMRRGSPICCRPLPARRVRSRS